MNYRKGFLLASFVENATENEILEHVNFICNNLDLTNKFIFLLQHKDTPEKQILTYNALVEKGKPFHPHLYTMRLHRKKQTNTLYTINALNAAVAAQHEGNTGKDLKLNWDEYANSLLLTAGKNLQIYPIEVVKIFKIEEPPEEN